MAFQMLGTRIKLHQVSDGRPPAHKAHYIFLAELTSSYFGVQKRMQPVSGLCMRT